MPRPIDADAVLDILRNFDRQHADLENGSEDFVYGIETAIEVIEDAPPAQPKITEAQVKEYCEKRCLVVLTFDAFYRLKSAQPERKKGKWKKGIGENGVTTSMFCSMCNYENKHWNDWYFCPNCGTDMRDEDDDIPMEYFESGGI